MAILNKNNITIENTAMQVISVWGYETKVFCREYTRYKLNRPNKSLIGEDKWNAFRCVDNHIRFFESDLSTIINYISEQKESNVNNATMLD